MPSVNSPRKVRKKALTKVRGGASSSIKSATKSSARGDLAPERIAGILKGLDEAYPEAVCALTHRTPWELLVATILSAQCTDVRVNMVTPELFKRFPTPEAMAKAEIPELIELIRNFSIIRRSRSRVRQRRSWSGLAGRSPRRLRN